MFSCTKEGKNHENVGIVPNKLIAKIASGFWKPDDLTVVRPKMCEIFFSLSVSKILGIGGKTTEALKLMGITKVKKLANCDIQLLSEMFGKMGIWMKQVAHGLDFSEGAHPKTQNWFPLSQNLEF